jgi:hypothetical protein
VFLVATSGRSGTLALTHGLDAFSDHRVAHEPDPLLAEGWSKHRGLPYRTERLQERIDRYARRQVAGERYGESIRTPNLLPELLAAAPGAPLLVIVREPRGWVRSAHQRRVLRKGDEWDRFRLLPDDDREERPLARRLAGHWCTVNRYLLAFAERYRPAAVVLHQPMAPVLAEWARFLGVTLTRREELAAFLATRPNRSGGGEEPEGMEQVEPLCRELWQQARELARRHSAGSAVACG